MPKGVLLKTEECEIQIDGYDRFYISVILTATEVLLFILKDT